MERKEDDLMDPPLESNIGRLLLDPTLPKRPEKGSTQEGPCEEPPLRQGDQAAHGGRGDKTGVRVTLAAYIYQMEANAKGPKEALREFRDTEVSMR